MSVECLTEENHQLTHQLHQVESELAHLKTKIKKLESNDKVSVQIPLGEELTIKTIKVLQEELDNYRSENEQMKESVTYHSKELTESKKVKQK